MNARKVFWTESKINKYVLLSYVVLSGLIVVGVFALTAHKGDNITRDSVPPISLVINLPAQPTLQAVRIVPPIQETPLPPDLRGNEMPVGGLFNMPAAPDGLSDCDEMNFYRVQAGLPDRFASIGWRESNCRNEEGVKTYCCYGYWQMNFKVHMADRVMIEVYARCGVRSIYDYNGDELLDKQKQACTAKGLYDLKGFSPWQ